MGETGYVSAMRRYFEFSGRSTRSEFWIFMLVYLIIQMFALLGDAVLFGSVALEGGGIITAVLSLLHFIPSLSVGVRRLHDTDRSGWWLLISFIPLIGIIWLIVLWCQPGTDGRNDYGPRLA